MVRNRNKKVKSTLTSSSKVEKRKIAERFEIHLILKKMFFIFEIVNENDRSLSIFQKKLLVLKSWISKMKEDNVFCKR